MARRSKTRLKNKADNIPEEIAEQTNFGSPENNIQDACSIFHARQYAFTTNLDVKNLRIRVIFTQ